MDPPRCVQIAVSKAAASRGDFPKNVCEDTSYQAFNVRQGQSKGTVKVKTTKANKPSIEAIKSRAKKAVVAQVSETTEAQ